MIPKEDPIAPMAGFILLMLEKSVPANNAAKIIKPIPMKPTMDKK